ncbi:MAG: hypothetical protein ACLTXO_00495 [Fusobacterium varium]|uniref:hypothetical protein n=2 Tax=Fusobacterium varium TaxID=856 RepID=UPI0039949493
MNKILIITEGTKPDKKIVEHLIKNYKQADVKYEIQTYNTNVYMLYQEIKRIYGEDLDEIQIIPILKEKNIEFKFNKDDFSEIYLFFDYDIHHYQYNRDIAPDNLNSQLEEMLNYFNDETGDMGKLYINYPMVEVFFQSSLSSIDISSLNSYKSIPVINGNKGKFIQKPDYFDLKKINEIFERHIAVENFLVNEERKVPNYSIYRQINQIKIFQNEVEKYVKPSNAVLELSCFSRFIIDYFGEKIYNKYFTIY